MAKEMLIMYGMMVFLLVGTTLPTSVILFLGLCYGLGSMFGNWLTRRFGDYAGSR